MGEEPTTAPADTQAAWEQALAKQDKPEPQDTVEETTNEAPSEETSAGTPEANEESFTNFRIEDVPEEHREYVEKAYKQLQGDYTRKTQSLAEERRQAEAAMQFVSALQSEDQQADAIREIAEAFGGENKLLELLGYETDDATDVPAEGLSEIELMQRQLDGLIAERDQERQTAQQRAEQEAEKAQLDRIDKSVADQLAALPDAGEISAEEQELLVGHALANLPPDDNGLPQIRAAYDFLTGAFTKRDQRWAKSKETTHVAPGGVAATQVPDLDNETDRRDFLAEHIAQFDAAQQGN